MILSQEEPANGIQMNEKCPRCNEYFNTKHKRPLLRSCGHSCCEECTGWTKCCTCKKKVVEDWTFPENVLLIKLAIKLYNAEKEERKMEANKIDVENLEIEKKFKNLLQTIKSDDADIRLNKQLICISYKIKKYKNTLPDYLDKLGMVNEIAYSQTAYSLTKCITEGQTLMKKLVEYVNKNESELKKNLTTLPNLPNTQAINKMFDFNDDKTENINALKGTDNCYVGYRIDNLLRFGEIRTVDNSLLFSAFKISKEEIIPEEATIVHFNWIKEFILKYRMLFLELEMIENDSKKGRNKSKCLKTILISITIKEDFMNCPYARSFYYSCTGENGYSFNGSNVSVKQTHIQIEHLISTLRSSLCEVVDEKMNVLKGGVYLQCENDGSYGFIINRNKNMNVDGKYFIGSLYDLTCLQFFKENMKLKIINCGYIII